MKLRLNVGNSVMEDFGGSSDSEFGEGESPFPLSAVEKLERVFEEELPLLCQEIEKYAEVEFSVSFLDSAEMRAVNKEHRGLDEPTDVLTFPLWEGPDGSLSFNSIPFNSLPFGPLPLGDILICPSETEKEHPSGTDKAEVNKTDINKMDVTRVDVSTPKANGVQGSPTPGATPGLCLVLAHGFLHLLGWDHDTPEKESAMWERQELLQTKLLKALEAA